MNINKVKIAEFLSFCESNSHLTLGFKPYDCGSWRGVYAEACVFVETDESTLGDFLPFLERLLSEEFYGYKGGEYRYSGHTTLNIERGHSSYSDDNSMFPELIGSNKEVFYAFITQ